jgi:hypothetical protein
MPQMNVKIVDSEGQKIEVLKKDNIICKSFFKIISVKSLVKNIYCYPTPRNQRVVIKSKSLVTKLIKIVQLGSESNVSNSSTFPFTANDLVNNKLKKVHGWNTKNIDTTVIDNFGMEIAVSSQVDTTHVEIDLSRISVQGTWYLLIEK